MARRTEPAAREWLPADTALWTTCHIVSDVLVGRVPEHRIQTMFPLAQNEIAFAGGNIAVDSFHSAGDGSYNQSTTFAFGTGVFGLALAAGTLAGSAAGNAARRDQAAANAQAAWRPSFGGTIFVTNTGFLLQTMEGLFRWDWESIDLMQVVGYNCVVMQARSQKGLVTWRLLSEWSELVFVLWAMKHHPAHPQLADGTWLPQNWLEWATAQGYRPHLNRPELA